MSYDGSAHRRQRGTGKCLLSRMVNVMENLLRSSPSNIKPATLENCQDNVAKAHRVFQEYHDIIVERDSTLTDEQNETELKLHDESMLQYQEAYYDVKHRADAWVRGKKVRSSLKALELQLGGTYSPERAAAFATLEVEMDDLREIFAPDDISEHIELKALKQEIEEIWAELVTLRADAGFSTETLPPGVGHMPEVRTGTADRHGRSNIKVPPPKFGGQLSEFTDFKELFMSVVNGESLPEASKKALFVHAMTTPETKSNAMSACKTASTLSDAMATFGARYEDKKEVLAYHLGMILNMAPTGRTKAELETMERVSRNSRAGLEMVGAFTGEQMTIACLVNKMKPELKMAWLNATNPLKDPPDYATFQTFLRDQARIVTGLKSMETVIEQDQAGLPQDTTPSPKERHQGKSQSHRSKRWESKPTSSKTVFRSHPDRKCAYCEGTHVIHACRDFKAKSLVDKRAAVKAKHLCHNCLSSGHRVAECPSERNCPTCGGRHHSFLHEDREPGASNSVSRVLTASDKGLATTASIIVDAGGVEKVARLLVDTGAEVSVVTEALAKSLKAEKLPNSAVRLVGMGQTESSYAVRLNLHGDSRVGKGEDVVEVVAQVVKNIAQPTGTRSVSEFRHVPCVQRVPLADPSYRAGARIDILLSNSGWCTARMLGTYTDEETGLFVDKSVFGWVIAGPLRGESSRSPPEHLRVFPVTRADRQLNELIEKQWKLEELPGEESPLSKEELAANEHFFATHCREDGRHLVGIPPASNGKTLGESYSQAARRYRSVQKTLVKRGQWSAYYEAVLSFIEDGHAELVPDEDLKKPHTECYYMPMHAIVKPSSTSTKVRPVCDASACSSSGFSYNDVILVGPSLYQPLTSITNKFRDTAIGMTADVSRMYRQITLHRDDRDYHRFLFAIDGGPLRVYRMTRLTFGVKSSPFLACKVMEQIGVKNQVSHPLASNVLREQVYMDDVLTGADTIEEATAIREDLNELLTENMFTLCKWRTSSRELMATIPPALRETTKLTIGSSPMECQKALGIHWSTEEDELFVATPKFKVESTVTKRILTSVTARIFDPMGWHAPAVMSPRMMTQEAWKIPSGWDEPLPSTIYRPFKQWAEQMPRITDHAIPRAFGDRTRVRHHRELHGFADASEKGYGGVIYLRTVYEDGVVTVDQVMAKGRVAPLKRLTIPRLELKGALVTAQLLQAAAKDLQVESDAQFAWSDSMVVLGWLEHSPSRLDTFVANRVGQIQSLTEGAQWGHVPRVNNPADCLSRGVTPTQLVELRLWWKGPTWLTQSPESWPKVPNAKHRELPEMRKVIAMAVPPVEETGRGQRDARRWTRVVAWCRRFIRSCRRKLEDTAKEWLSAKELVEARTTTWIISQRFSYKEEYETLKKGKSLPKTHPLARYNLFLDGDDVIRVGGRLRNSNLPASTIHPVVLHPRSVFTRLLVEEVHVRLRHASTSAMISTLTYTYYIPRLSRIIRSIRSSCLVCQKAFARPAGQQMGDLPAVRTEPAEVFARVGVDYAGPVYTKAGRGRTYREIPTYLALFVCLTTRAIHIEVAADASTAAFLAVLDRFVGRRGLPEEVWCDNGTNFVGAKTELRQIMEELQSNEAQERISTWAGSVNISWTFSPPKGPNFGGLWEAGVKSMKRLMGEVLKSPRLNLDELNTVAVSCEAILNSRPYLPLYTTVEDDLEPLTPGHFLVHRPLCALPQRVKTISRLSRARRWQLVRDLQATLWQRWRAEYVRTLQNRNKQVNPEPNLKIGDVVLVQEDGVRRNQWPLARICEVYPGPDGLVRVVDIQLTRRDPKSKGTRTVRWRRTVRDLIPLPLHVDKDDVNENEDTGVNAGGGEDVQA